MCGLCGVAGTVTVDDIKVFKDLLVVSAIRGIDSTGVAVVPYSASNFEPQIIKAVGNSFELLDRIQVSRALSTDNAMFMGHTRWRTRGEVNKQNAQPFEFPGLIGTHNGTLENSTKSRLEGATENFGTDSAALYNSINKIGLEATLGKIEDIDAAALVWWDKEANTLNMYRNRHRPLHWAFNRKRDTFYWASEAGMLHLALNHNKVDFKNTHRLEEGQLLTLELPEKTGQTLGKPHIKPIRVEPFEYPKIERKMSTAEESARIFLSGERRDLMGQSALPFSSGVASSITSVAPGATTHSLISMAEFKERNAKYKADTLQNRSEEAGGPFYKTARGQVLDEAAFDDKANEGCALNGEVPIFGEPVKFLRDDSFICASCLAMAKSGTLDVMSAEALDSML